MLKAPILKKTLAGMTLGLALGLSGGQAEAASFTLYDSATNLTPNSTTWSWVYQNQPNGTVKPTVSGGVLHLNTTANNGFYAGYFKSTTPTFSLNRLAGYTLEFTLKLNSETHTSSNRAGFSLIAMSQLEKGETQPYGLELGFWQNNIWAQNVGFTKGETTSFNTTLTQQTYRLQVLNNQYQLFVGNATGSILSGVLRQYTGFTPPPGSPNPYTTSNLIFLGDNTTSAAANVSLTRVAANTGTATSLTAMTSARSLAAPAAKAVPEPTAAVGLVVLAVVSGLVTKPLQDS